MTRTASRHRVAGCAIVLAATTFALAVPSFGQAATTADGVYTAEQAESAKAVYERACASCHGDNLQGSANAPPLSGFAFTSYWSGKTLADLWPVLHTMPADNPGSLTDEQYTNLLALILEANTYPAGDTALAADETGLAGISIVAPAQ